MRWPRNWWFRRRFKPVVFYNEPLKLTQVILEDAPVVWCALVPNTGHDVDIGYDASDGRLVGVQIWADVRVWSRATQRSSPDDLAERGYP
jgi:hypothetical protein